jgi:hypothetical protein
VSVTVTVTETSHNDIVITAQQVVVTTHEGVALFNAGDISVLTIEGLEATNIQDALHELSDNKFVQAAAPAAADPNLQDGDLWYNTTDNKLMVYRRTIWEEITIDSQLSESSDTSEYTDVTLNGGYF